MVEITEIAAQKIQEFKTHHNKIDAYLRLFVAGFGCSGPDYGMTLDESKKEEDVLEEGFGVAMVYDQQLESFMDGVKIEFIEFGEGAGRFRIINTKQENNCADGCSCC